MKKLFKNIIGLLFKNYFVIIAILAQQNLIKVLGLEKYTLDVILRFISSDWENNVAAGLFVRFFMYFVLSVVIFSGVFAILRREYFNNKSLIIIFLEGIKKYWYKVALSFVVFFVPFKILGSFVVLFLSGYDWIYSIVIIFLWIYENIIFILGSLMLIDNMHIKDMLKKVKSFILSKKFMMINLTILLISILIAPFDYLIYKYLADFYFSNIGENGKIDFFELIMHRKPSIWIDYSILLIKTIGKSLLFVYLVLVYKKER